MLKTAPTAPSEPRDLLAIARDSAEDAIVLTVAYADIFDAPISASAIHQFLIGQKMSFAAVDAILSNGIAPQRLHRTKQIFTLPQREHLISAQAERAARAAQLWPIARKYGRWIGKLPFVRMVAVTGSLAVNNPKADADIDYLIIVANGRLWLTRLLIVALTKWVERSGITLCPNFLLTERALYLPDHTLYAARELAQMIPLSGREAYLAMWQANSWVYDYLPNTTQQALPPPTKRSVFKRVAEWLLAGRMGQWVENWERERKLLRYRSRGDSAEINYSADICKGHKDAHGKRTMNGLQQRLKQALNNN